MNGLRGETETLDKMERRVRHDLHYIENWSLALDIRIIGPHVAVRLHRPLRVSGQGVDQSTRGSASGMGVAVT